MKIEKVKLTYKDLFKEYFGEYREIVRKPLPFECKCQQQFMHLSLIWGHLKEHARQKYGAVTIT